MKREYAIVEISTDGDPIGETLIISLDSKTPREVDILGKLLKAALDAIDELPVGIQH